MTRKSLLIAVATALLALCLPMLASAQGQYDPYGRNGDYRRNDDYRRNGNYDPYYGNYDPRQLRNVIRQLRDDSRRLQSDLDRALDHSRVNGTRREDDINMMARDFRNAADDLKNRFGDGNNRNDVYRSQSDAQRVLDIGSRMDRVLRRAYMDQRVANDWSQITNELNYISNAFGNRGGYYNNGGYYPNGSNYPDNRRRTDDQERRRRIADEIFRRFPN